MVKIDSRLLSLLSVAWLFVTGVAYGYPENIRLGYASCSSCHVSPTGGSTLTDYGATIADEMSTWSYSGEGRADWGLLSGLPEDIQKYVNVGGDVRYVHMKIEEPVEFYDQFSMQNEAELALHTSSEVTFVSSIGSYGKRKSREFRRHYVLYKPSESVRFRLGRFFPAYGIMLSDHTIAVRRPLGFDQGRETYNAELSYLGSNFELNITSSIGEVGNIRAESEHGVRYMPENEASNYFRAIYYINKKMLAGGSYKFGRSRDDTINRQFGFHVSAALDKSLYGLFEIDKKLSDFRQNDKPMTDVYSYAKLAHEFFKGAHIYYTHEYLSVMSANSIGLQWFPRPHFEFDLRYKVDQLSRSMLLASHFYL